MEQMEFNLLDEPWIRVLKKDCSEQEVSITEALIHAHEYLDLSGDMPVSAAGGRTSDTGCGAFALAAGNFADGLLPRRSGG